MYDVIWVLIDELIYKLMQLVLATMFANIFEVGHRKFTKCQLGCCGGEEGAVFL